MTTRRVLAPEALDDLIAALRADGFRVVGPRRRDGAIVHDDLESIDDLPRGWTDEQGPATYRLHRRDDDALFQYAVGPDSPRGELFPSRHTMWSSTFADDGTLHVVAPTRTGGRIAFLGVRACELAAVAIQDRVLLGGLVRDTVYELHRDDALFVPVQCTAPAATCFCASMQAGPGVSSDDELADLVLTELVGDDGDHELLAEPRSDRGAALLERLPSRSAGGEVIDRAERHVAAAAAAQTRSIDTDIVHDLLLGNLEHPRWDDVAERCLTCGNCTLVCPSCFCVQVEDVTSVDGLTATRERRWDSCFTLEHSHTGFGSVRSSASSRYRQWMTHKLATWIDQFDSSGCVGCGRCISWCPVGIDITEEVAAIAADPVSSTTPGAVAPGPMPASGAASGEVVS